MKLKALIQQISVLANSSKTSAFLEGVRVHLPAAGEIEIRAEKSLRSIRPLGLKWNEYSYITELRATNGIHAFGYGESDNQLLSLQKSIAEGAERIVYRSLKQTAYGSKSSNGWAAHITAKRAEFSAMTELLERDAALLHWLSGTPLVEIPSSDFPKRVSTWMNSMLIHSQVFKRLRILVSYLGHLPTVTTVLLDNEGHAVLSHATDKDLLTAIDKALGETCRIAHIAMDCDVGPTKTELPEEHALWYAKNEKLPEFIFGEQSSYAAANRKWQKQFSLFNPNDLGVRFHTMKCGSLYVSRASCDRVQDLFFGDLDKALSKGWINSHRIAEAVGFKTLNPLPHFVP